MNMFTMAEHDRSLEEISQTYLPRVREGDDRMMMIMIMIMMMMMMVKVKNKFAPVLI
jgi:hypothetical protein